MTVSFPPIFRHFPARSVAACAIAICAGLVVAGCGKNDSGRGPSSARWQEVSANETSVVELNPASIRTSAENANWRDYQFQRGPRNPSAGGNVIRSYTLIDATMDCVNQSMRINSQRTYYEPYGKGEQISHYPGQPRFAKIDNTPYGAQMVTLVCD